MCCYSVNAYHSPLGMSVSQCLYFAFVVMIVSSFLIVASMEYNDDKTDVYIGLLLRRLTTIWRSKQPNTCC